MGVEARHARNPVAAGLFYPSDPVQLRRLVERLLDEVEPSGIGRPRAVIVPHAGYRYSGPTAASAYALLRLHSDRCRKVMLLGPSHFDAFGGVTVPEASAFSGPLGEVPVDGRMRAAAEQVAGVVRSDQPHLAEHSLEVQFPFLTVVLAPGFSALPVLSGDEDDVPGANVIDRVLDEDPDTLIVISSDLSHYLPYEPARRRDEATAESIERGRTEGLGPGCACGRTAIAALLRASGRRGWACRRLDLRSSGDTEGDRDRVVGYGAFAFVSGV